MRTPFQNADHRSMWSPVTARGEHLKQAMAAKGLSTRGLARLWAEQRAGTPIDSDDGTAKARRRALHRYLDEDRDVSDATVEELSPLLDLGVESWPAKRPHYIHRMRAELAKVRGEAAAEVRADVARPAEDHGTPQAEDVEP